MDYELIIVSIIGLIASFLIPLSILLLDKKVKFAILSFFFAIQIPVISYYLPLGKFRIFEITLIAFLVWVSAFPLLEIKIQQYKDGLISSKKLWLSNILIFVCVIQLPMFRQQWGAFFYDEEYDLNAMFVVVLLSTVAVPAGILFLICSLQRTRIMINQERLGLIETPVTSESPQQSPHVQ